MYNTENFCYEKQCWDFNEVPSHIQTSCLSSAVGRGLNVHQRRVPLPPLFVLSSVFLFITAAPAFADNTPPEHPAAHFVRPVSKSAENVTVITADDITRINAHTLAEILQTVPGIQLDYLRTPSSATSYTIQGTSNEEVLVLMDGIRQNGFDQGRTLPGLIPVQQIERIEIIKGAASPVWGAAPGGVINIITKTPVPDRTAAGMVSGSIGSRFTADSRAELSGTASSFGYYLTAGNLRSDGLSPNTATNMNSLYGKLSYLLPGSGSVTAGGSYLSAQPGLNEGDTTRWGVDSRFKVFLRDWKL